MEINGLYYCSRCMRRMEKEGKCPHCGYDGTQERNLSALEEGTLLNDKYQLGAVIGQGGFGITYAAWDENLDRPVAVKEYFPADFVTRNTDVSDEVTCLEKNQTAFLEGRLRFERESHLLAALQEIPNVVRVLDYFSENNTAYIVMEYIHGVPLDEWFSGQKLKPAQILQVMRPVITNQLKYIDTWAFEYNQSLKSLNLSGVITIGQEALSGCLSLTEANLSNNLTGIDVFAFMSTGIDGLVVPGSLIVVPISSFAASPMRWIVLEPGVKHIDTYSFVNCNKLQYLVLPPGLRRISSEAVSNYFCSTHIWIYDPEVQIDQMAFYKFAPDPFPYATLEEAFAENPTPIIHGFPGSTAEEYARTCGFEFVKITETYENTVKAVQHMGELTE